MKKKHVTLAAAIVITARLAAEEAQVQRALVLWRQNPGISSAFHLVTSGLFLARDLGALG